MIKGFILDDERGSIDSLLWELENFKDIIEIIGESQDPISAIETVNKLKPDVVFLDIQMPQMSGFEFLKQFTNIDFQVIFTTAYDEFAIQAFKVNAIEYLLKPIDESDLRQALEKLSQQHHDKAINEKIESLLSIMNNNSNNNKTLIFPTMSGLEFIKIDQIVRCESDSNYTSIYTLGNKPLLVSKTLKEVEELLEDKGFYRIHHSHLININYIKKYIKRNSGSVILEDGTEIPVSRSRKKDFLDRI